jgi:hypothetical protein
VRVMEGESARARETGREIEREQVRWRTKRGEAFEAQKKSRAGLLGLVGLFGGLADIRQRRRRLFVITIDKPEGKARIQTCDRKHKNRGKCQGPGLAAQISSETLVLYEYPPLCIYITWRGSAKAIQRSGIEAGTADTRRPRRDSV